MILAQREHLTLAKSEVTVGRLEIERLKLMLAKARREQFGQSSERGKLLVEQLELAIEDLEETQAEQEAKRRPLNASRGAGRLSSTSARSSPAGTARRSLRRRRPPIRSRAALPGRACWRWCWSTSSCCISR